LARAAAAACLNSTTATPLDLPLMRSSRKRTWRAGVGAERGRGEGAQA
jgi:hypothetical protein